MYKQPVSSGKLTKKLLPRAINVVFTVKAFDIIFRLPGVLRIVEA